MEGLVTTPLGLMRTAFDDSGRLTELAWRDDSIVGINLGESSSLTTHVQVALDAYFAGEALVPHVDLAPRGTDFQRSVWTAVSAIAQGTTETYGTIAQRLGNPAASRAVGLANSKNPIAIFIPCHRLLGRDGGLRGYAGGLKRKQSLLMLEVDS